MQTVYIVSLRRTPIGSFLGALATESATALGSVAIQGALNAISLDPKAVDEVFFGNVLAANLGQAPARQAALGAGISSKTPCTTINKVCASGMKSVMFGAQSIMLGHASVVVAGGMESMTNTPYYLPKARAGYKYGHGELVDGLLHDGLWEAYNGFPMGNCGEHIAKEMKITRAMQDDYCVRSYERAIQAGKEGIFREEMVPISIPQRKGDPLLVAEDEEPKRVSMEKIPHLRPVFAQTGTITAANASSINDGAACLVLMSEQRATALGVTPLARIRGFADAAQDPIYFTTAPALAIPLALERAEIAASSVDYYEINEAFSVVALANMRLLELSPDRVNVFGGAVALGHPLGCSGARILVTLYNVLRKKEGTVGVAAICNGGGGASAMVIERV